MGAASVRVRDDLRDIGRLTRAPGSFAPKSVHPAMAKTNIRRRSTNRIALTARRPAKSPRRMTRSCGSLTMNVSSRAICSYSTIYKAAMRQGRDIQEWERDKKDASSVSSVACARWIRRDGVVVASEREPTEHFYGTSVSSFDEPRVSRESSGSVFVGSAERANGLSARARERGRASERGRNGDSGNEGAPTFALCVERSAHAVTRRQKSYVLKAPSSWSRKYSRGRSPHAISLMTTWVRVGSAEVG